MNEAELKVIHSEYQALISIGATREQALHQVSISFCLHPEYLVAILDSYLEFHYED